MFYRVLAYGQKNKGHAQVIKSEQPEYARRIDKVSGEEIFEVSRTIDMHDFIQAGNVNLTPAALVDLYGVSGGNQLGPEFFTDEFVKPKDLLDAHSRLTTLRANFEKSDLVFRQKYGFDFGQFLRSFSSDNSDSFEDFVDSHFASRVVKKKDKKKEVEENV